MQAAARPFFDLTGFLLYACRGFLPGDPSPRFTVGGATWNVLLQMDERSNSVGVFLDSSPMQEQDPEFSVNAVFELSAENKDPFRTEPKPLYHLFCADSADWGFRELVWE